MQLLRVIILGATSREYVDAEDRAERKPSQNTRAVTKQSVSTCVSTSGPDVYTRGIASDHQTDLRLGDSLLVKPGTLIVRIFSTQSGNAKFSAELSLKSAGRARKPSRR